MGRASNDDRRFSRSTVILIAVIEHQGISIPVKISNVSATGALVIGSRLPPAGSEVVLRRNGLAVASRVSWADRDHAGIEFDAPVDVGELLRPISKSRETAFVPRPAT